jgi:hypothetical protein
MRYPGMSIRLHMIACNNLIPLEMGGYHKGNSPVRKCCQSKRKSPFSTAFPLAGRLRLIFA